MITVILIIAIVVFVVTCLFPGIVISRIALDGYDTENYFSLKRYALGTAVILSAGVLCTIAFFILIPLVIIGAILVFALMIIYELYWLINRR
jgi:hypothetical protein